MKLLYISSDHIVLEYDDLVLFTELGIDWFSTGHYLNPKNPVGDIGGVERESIIKEPNLDLIEKFKLCCPNKQIHGPSVVSKEFVDNFDIVMVSHCCPWPFGVLSNWENIKHKPVIWRTYCQQQSAIEKAMFPLISQGLKVIRVSPNEQNIRHALPMTKVIRAYVDAEHYFGWTGEEKHVLTFNNFFNRRQLISNTREYLHVVRDIPHKIYGGSSDGNPEVLGYLTWTEQKEAYRKSRAYFALGSKPAALTFNLVEAMLTGTPTVTWGKMLGNWIGSEWQGTYEACELIKHGENGFASDNLEELNSILKELMNNDYLARSVSEKGRSTILTEFNKEKVKKEWKEFLESL